MHVTRKVAFAVLAALCLLPLFSGVATALRDLNFSETVINLLSRALTIEAGGLRTVCEVGLTLSLTNANVPKREGEVVGEVAPKVLGQEVPRERCSMNRAHFLVNRQLHYKDFIGNLPNITFIDFVIGELELLVQTALYACLIRAEVILRKEVHEGILGSGAFFTFTANNVFQLSGICPEPHEWSARGSLSYVGPPRTVIVRLV